MTETRQSTNTQKLDEILRKLGDIPSAADFERLNNTLENTTKEIGIVNKRVDKLTLTVYGDDEKKVIGLVVRVLGMEKIIAWLSKAGWGIALVLISAIGIGIVKLIQIGAN